MDVTLRSSLVLNAALVGEPPSRVPERDPGEVGGHLLPGPVAGDAGVAPVRAPRPVPRGQRRARGVSARSVAPGCRFSGINIGSDRFLFLVNLFLYWVTSRVVNELSSKN